MAANRELLDHALELLSCLGPTRARRMFGGAGLYAGDQFVALVVGDQLYLKADAQAQPAFAAAGSQPFGYATAGGRRTVLGYWSAPEDAMESPAQMRAWALLALDSALRAGAARAAKASKVSAAGAPPQPARRPRTRRPAGPAS